MDGKGTIHYKDWTASYIPHILKELYIDRLYDPYLQGKKDLTIFDLGCNIGLFSIYASQYAKKIYAFEPSPESYDLAKQNFKDNKITNVELFKKAIEKENGQVEFYYNSNTTMNSTVAAVNDNSKEKELVDAIRLDDFVKQQKIDHIDFIKWDTEGNEGEVLGSKSFENIAGIVDTVVMELHSWGNYNPQQLVNTFRDYGYRVIQLPTEATVIACTKK